MNFSRMGFSRTFTLGDCIGDFKRRLSSGYIPNACNLVARNRFYCFFNLSLPVFI